MRPLTTAMVSLALVPLSLLAQNNSNIALPNGRWFDGRSFELRTAYSVDGRLTFRKPARVDRTIDLAGTWIVPPFAEAHNHNITGWEHDAVEERNLKVISKYVADGVFYVKIQGSFPLTDALRRRLPINRPGAPDVAFAQTFLTATGGHPIALHEQLLLPRGYYPGLAKAALDDQVYFTIDSEADLETKWPRILALRPDFIKTNLWFSEEFAQRKNDPAYFGRKALDPALLPRIVRKAHASSLKVSAHVVSGADFHFALSAGVERSCMCQPHRRFPKSRNASAARVRQTRCSGYRRDSAALTRFNPADPSSLPLRAEDARLAARRGTVVITTFALSAGAPPEFRSAWQGIEAATLRLLNNHGVVLAVGSDNPADSSVLEASHLQSLGVLDNLTVLKMWTEATPRRSSQTAGLATCARAMRQASSRWRAIRSRTGRTSDGSKCVSSRVSRCIPDDSRAGARCGSARAR